VYLRSFNLVTTECLETEIFRRAAEIRRKWGIEPPLSDLLQSSEEMEQTPELQIEDLPNTEISKTEEVIEAINPEIIDDVQFDTEPSTSKKRDLVEKLGGNTIPLVRRLGRNIPSQVKFRDKIMHPHTVSNILTSVLEELLILRPDIINKLESIYPCRKPRFSYDSSIFPDYVKFEKLSNGMYVFSTSNVVRTIRMTYSILDLCGYKKEELRMIFYSA